MTTYKHGGDLQEFSKKFKINIKDIIDLSSNINHVKPNITLDLNKVNLSSYPNYKKLYETIAKHYKIKPDSLEVFNGASSAIYSLFKIIKASTVVIYNPIYSEYHRVTKCLGFDTININRYENIHNSIPLNSIVVFVNPSTPDGIYYNLEKLLSTWIKKNATILIDESFLDFTNYSSLINYLNKYEKIYIIKSLTKYYGSAGIRIGIVIGNKKNIEYLKNNEPIWKISQLDSCYIQSAISDKSLQYRTQNELKHNKKILKQILENSYFIDSIYPSVTNYFLIKLKNIDAKEFQSLLANEKIFIRDCSNFYGLNKNYVRIAIKDIDSIMKLKKALNSKNVNSFHYKS